VIKRAAREYLRGLGPRRHELSYRFDIVIIQRTADGRHIPHHFENVPLFSKGKHI
jgi:Holliday junction resolvase-like predicted endonuclease